MLGTAALDSADPRGGLAPCRDAADRTANAENTTRFVFIALHLLSKSKKFLSLNKFRNHTRETPKCGVQFARVLKTSEVVERKSRGGVAQSARFFI